MSSGLERNKIAAAILLASLIAMVVGTVANILYKPQLNVAERGYKVEISGGGNLTDHAGVINEENQPVDIEKIMANANAEAGAKIIKKCVSCHSFAQNEPHKIGPNLWKIVDAPKGASQGYSYSKTMLNAGGIWDQNSLYHFLNKPGAYLPGTKMSFAGISNPQDIANVIAYLKETSK